MMSAVNHSAGTATRTVRIDQRVDDRLRRLAGEERVSVNHLVNKSLRKLVEWDSYAEKFGVVSVPAALLNRMMDFLSESEAQDLGRWAGASLIREFATFWFKEMSTRNLVRDYPRLTAMYGRTFEYEEREEGGRWVIILKHGGGVKWSLFYAEVLRALFTDVVRREAAIESTENQVVARFSLA